LDSYASCPHAIFVRRAFGDGANHSRKAREDQRKVKCCDIGSSSLAEAIAQWQRHYGHFYRFVEPGRILSPECHREVRAEGGRDGEGQAGAQYEISVDGVPRKLRMTEHRLSATSIQQIEFKLEKAERGMAMLIDAERVMQLRDRGIGGDPTPRMAPSARAARLRRHNASLCPRRVTDEKKPRLCWQSQ